MSKGIDFGYGKVEGSAIKSAGYEFVCRYLSHSPAKNLTSDELTDFHNNNLDVVVVWETTTGRVVEGQDAGVEDAKAAQSQMEALGYPDTAIYFAADDDFQASDQPEINSYLKGVASVIGLDRTGVYSGYGVVKRCFDSGVVTYGWQTYAWSHSQWDDRAQLRQTYIYGPKLQNVQCDTDESVQDDFGQF